MFWYTNMTGVTSYDEVDKSVLRRKMSDGMPIFIYMYFKNLIIVWILTEIVIQIIGKYALQYINTSVITKYLKQSSSLHGPKKNFECIYWSSAHYFTTIINCQTGELCRSRRRKCSEISIPRNTRTVREINITTRKTKRFSSVVCLFIKWTYNLYQNDVKSNFTVHTSNVPKSHILSSKTAKSLTYVIKKFVTSC